MTHLILPQASDPVVDHADWLECQVLQSASGYVSWADHQRDLRIAGIDEGVESYVEDTSFEFLIDDITAELSDRERACGNATGYPFVVSRDGLSLRSRSAGLVYRFLLLLTVHGKDAGPSGSHGERLFEELCAESFASYLGKPSAGVSVRVFGFPRRMEPKGFAEAVDMLCRDLREGMGHRKTPLTKNQKDAHLDVIAWRGFPDGRQGQLIAFGQCSTGTDWRTKLTELQPAGWCRLWMRAQPFINPMKCFFVPRCIERDQWEETNISGGICFDRCRLVWLASLLSNELAEAIVDWTETVWRRESAA